MRLEFENVGGSSRITPKRSARERSASQVMQSARSQRCAGAAKPPRARLRLAHARLPAERSTLNVPVAPAAAARAEAVAV